MSTLSLTHCCQKTRPSTIPISPGYLFRSKGNNSIFLPPPARRRPTSILSTSGYQPLRSSVQFYSLPFPEGQLRCSRTRKLSAPRNGNFQALLGCLTTLTFAGRRPPTLTFPGGNGTFSYF